jgi:Flp pilus assembly protein TadD
VLFRSATPRSSYLLTLAKVKDLYRTRNYEIALVELVALEREYPNDERIMSMKGSLYEKVGRRQLARESWEAVLAINPYNLQVAEALQRLGK